ncbi:MAG: Ig-like domain-containing protein [Candidatus Limnocylindrales bacterium]|jgi:hypothetical protein
MAAFIVSGCLLLGLLTLTVGSGLMTDILSQLASAFGNAVGRLTSQAPPTAPPSGVALDTPVIDAPPNNGFTNQPSTSIQGSVPAAAIGKTGYAVDVYLIAKDGSRRRVASVTVGATTRFSTPTITLTEGNNVFVATLSTPTGEGGPSPVVTYILDTTPPKIAISSPAQGANVATSTVSVSGSCDAGSTISIRNEEAPGGAFSSQVVGTDGKFSLAVPVVAGPNTIDLSATDQAGNSSSTSLTINRDYGQLAAHLAVTPSKFSSSSQATLKLTLHATSLNGGPLANAKVTFTVTIYGLGPIVSPELSTDATGTATWQVAISGALAGPGQASVLVTSPAGDQAIGTAGITTTP